MTQYIWVNWQNHSHLWNLIICNDQFPILGFVIHGVVYGLELVSHKTVEMQKPRSISDQLNKASFEQGPQCPLCTLKLGILLSGDR